MADDIQGTANAAGGSYIPSLLGPTSARQSVQPNPLQQSIISQPDQNQFNDALKAAADENNKRINRLVKYQAILSMDEDSKPEVEAIGKTLDALRKDSPQEFFKSLGEGITALGTSGINEDKRTEIMKTIMNAKFPGLGDNATVEDKENSVVSTHNDERTGKTIVVDYNKKTKKVTVTNTEVKGGETGQEKQNRAIAVSKASRVGAATETPVEASKRIEDRYLKFKHEINSLYPGEDAFGQAKPPKPTALGDYTGDVGQNFRDAATEYYSNTKKPMPQNILGHIDQINNNGVTSTPKSLAETANKLKSFGITFSKKKKK